MPDMLPIGTRVRLDNPNDNPGRFTGTVAGYAMVATQMATMPPAMDMQVIVNLDEGAYLQDDRQIFISRLTVHPAYISPVHPASGDDTL